MILAQRLAYIELEVSNLAAWRAFANSILCAEVVDGPDGLVFLRIDDRPFRIALRQGPADDIRVLGLEVENKEGLARAGNALQAEGYGVEAGSAADSDRRQVAALIRVRDPVGLVVELSYGAMTRPQSPFYPPRPHAGFVTGDQGLGHVMLSVPNTAESQRLYETIGFRVSDYITTNYNGRDASFVFMRCNSRHHTLALGELPVPKRLLHFMLQCRDIDDVGRALDLVPASGWRQTRSLGRHINDKMISFYMETPSKIQVEYGWGGVEVGHDEEWSVSTYDVTSSWGHKHL